MFPSIPIPLLGLFLLPITLADQICGAVGTHDPSKIAFYMGNFFFKAPDIFALCADFCKNDARCFSFRYSYWADSDSQYCEFFGAWLDSFFIPQTPSPDEPGYYYYDIDCDLPAYAVRNSTCVPSTGGASTTTVTELQTSTLTQTTTKWSRTLTVTSRSYVTTTRVTTVTVRAPVSTTTVYRTATRRK